MGNLWLKVKVWTKVIVFALVLIYVTLFVINNSEREAKLWFWFGSNGNEVQTTILKLVLVTFLLGVLVTVLVRTTFRTIRQFREIKDASARPTSKNRKPWTATVPVRWRASWPK